MDWNPDGFKSIPKRQVDRKSTRLNSSHLVISYAVFCLKKKKTNNIGHAETGIVSTYRSQPGSGYASRLTPPCVLSWRALSSPCLFSSLFFFFFLNDPAPPKFTPLPPPAPLPT